MTRPTRGRSSSPTIDRSSIALAAGLALLADACAHAAPDATRSLDAREAPAPHLRGAAEPDARSHPEHVDAAPDPTTAETVSLGGLLAYADEHSPVLLVVRSTRSRAEATRVAASPLLPSNPQLTGSIGPRLGQSGRGLDAELGLAQQISVAGERRVRLRAAERFADLTEAEIDQLRWTVHCDVHAAFHRTLVERERAHLAEHVVGFQTEVLRVVERQIAAGEAPALALRLAQAELAQAQQLLVAAEQAFLASRIRLAQLSGWPVARPPIPEGTPDEPRDPPPFDQLVAIARERHPSLRAAVARVQEAESRVLVANREALPQPTIGAQYRREGNPSPEVAYDIVLGTLSIPIPSFQTNQGDRARARADVTVADAELTAARTLLDGQIAEASSEVVAAAQRTRAYGTEILPRFEENLTLLRRSFELGEIDILALSVGRERFLRIQSDALGAQLDYFVALAGLERVVGVDLWPDDHHEESTP